MSRARLEEHRRLWAERPALPAVYSIWFDGLLSRLPRGARVLEIGAGPGFLAATARSAREDIRWVASELLETPWNDVVADGLRLPLRDGCLDAVVGLDVVHHLSRPRRFFVEAARVLRESGQLLVIEPWVSPFSFPVYRFIHQEGCSLALDPWRPFPEGKDAFDGDAAVLWRLLGAGTAKDWSACGLSTPTCERFNGFAYLLSLGFRSWGLLPRPLIPAALGIDRLTRPLAPLTAMRALACWSRLPGPPPQPPLED